MYNACPVCHEPLPKKTKFLFCSIECDKEHYLKTRGHSSDGWVDYRERHYPTLEELTQAVIELSINDFVLFCNKTGALNGQ